MKLTNEQQGQGHHNPQHLTEGGQMKIAEENNEQQGQGHHNPRGGIVKIKIAEENEKKIELALSAVNGEACAHTYTTYNDIIGVIAKIERRRVWTGLTAKLCQGTVVYSVSGGSMPSAYKYRRQVTGITLIRGSGAWYLVRVNRASLWPAQAGYAIMTVSPGADAYLVAQLRGDYIVAQTVQSA